MASYIASCGGEHDRFKMGYRNVIDRAAQTQPEPALLAIETSGHSAWKDNRFVDDGTYTAARLIGRLARARREQGEPRLGLLDLVGDSLQEPLESTKVKMGVAAGLGGVLPRRPLSARRCAAPPPPPMAGTWSRSTMTGCAARWTRPAGAAG